MVYETDGRRNWLYRTPPERSAEVAPRPDDLIAGLLRGRSGRARRRHAAGRCRGGRGAGPAVAPGAVITLDTHESWDARRSRPGARARQRGQRVRAEPGGTAPGSLAADQRRPTGWRRWPPPGSPGPWSRRAARAPTCWRTAGSSTSRPLDDHGRRLDRRRGHVLRRAGRRAGPRAERWSSRPRSARRWPAPRSPASGSLRLLEPGRRPGGHRRDRTAAGRGGDRDQPAAGRAASGGMRTAGLVNEAGAMRPEASSVPGLTGDTTST